MIVVGEFGPLVGVRDRCRRLWASRLLRLRAFGGGTPKHAANIAQPRQAMIMINGRASAGCPVLSPCETAAVARRER
jgi:hypothetical protein